MEKPAATRRSRTRGHAALEIALLSPWIFFLFAGTLDMGFYAYALIATQNAARVAVEFTSTSPANSTKQDKACEYALTELSGMSNVRGLSSCGSLPLIVTAQQFTDGDGALAASVSVTYRTNRLIPIPGLPGRLTITRSVRMRIL